MTDESALKTEKAQPCTNDFCEHDHMAPPEKLALLAAIREAATTALNSVYGTDDRHEYMALRIADSAVNGTPLPWRYPPSTLPGKTNFEETP